MDVSGLILQVGRLGHAGVKWSLAGFPARSEADYRLYLSICKSCEFYKRNRCTLCGCNLRYKIAMATEDCPIEKWKKATPLSIFNAEVAFKVLTSPNLMFSQVGT